MNHLKLVKNEWIRKGPSEKIKLVLLMRTLLKSEMTRSYSQKNKKCSFKRLKIGKLLRDLETSTKCMFNPSKRKINI